MGKTPLQLSSSDDFKAVIRHVHVMSHFDRLGLALMINIPYGTVSRILTTLYNEGYIEKLYHIWDRKKVYERRGYSKGLPEANHEMRVNGKTNWSYTDQRTAHQQMYRVSSKWGEFLKRWNHFLEKGKDTWQAGRRTTSSSPRKPTRRTRRTSGQGGKTSKGGSRSRSSQAQSSVIVTVQTTTSASTRSRKGRVK